jgi:CubicO group peptidase (beta-lactamase class C family)
MKMAIPLARRAANLSSLTLLLTCPAVAAGQGPNIVRACQERRPALSAAFKDIQKRQRNIGLSGLVVLRGQTILSEYLGYADLEHRVPVSRDTRFGIASITKAFTGLALLKLNETGKVDLDAPIQKYVPSFPVKPGKDITLRLLAAHLAGIRHWRRERTPELYSRHFDDVMEILPLFKDDTLVSPPGSAENYSSYGYNLIGAAIQSASGIKYQEYVRREIIAPLGLANVGFDDVRRVQPNRARRYSYFHPWTFVVDSSEVYRVPDWDYTHNMAGGNMYATADDLARLGRAVERPGLLSPQSLDLLYTRPRVGAVEANMGFGFFIGDSTVGRRRLTIGGSNAGVQSGLFVYPDEDLIIVVLANTWGIGSRSGEMNQTLLERLAAICMGWPEPPPVR